MAPTKLSDDGYSHFIETAKKDTLSSALLISQVNLREQLNGNDNSKIHRSDIIYFLIIDNPTITFTCQFISPL